MRQPMLTYEYKCEGTEIQYAAIDEAIRVVQFIRNKCLRKWMDERGISQNDLQCYCAVLAADYPFAARLNSQARQASADRAWFAISRFYENCQQHKPGKKGYPQFQHDNRSVEYKTTGWKLDEDGRHITFTDGLRIGRLRLIGNRGQRIEAHLKVQRQREDFARKTANALITSSDLIAFEDLQIRNMVKNRHLSKSIHDAGWGQFLTWVKAYGVIHDIPVIAVPPTWTSADCSACGTRVHKSLSVRTHICPSCGIVLDRDHNAALNILHHALSGTVGHTGTDG
jgi:IS605 OrfB family transposase